MTAACMSRSPGGRRRGQLSRLDAGALPPDDGRRWCCWRPLCRPVTLARQLRNGKPRRSSSQRGWRSRRAALGGACSDPTGPSSTWVPIHSSSSIRRWPACGDGRVCGPRWTGQCHGARQSVEQAAAAAAKLYLHHFIDAARDAIVGLDRAGAVLLECRRGRAVRPCAREVLGRTASGLPFWSPELGQALARALDCDTTQTLQHETPSAAALEIVVAAVCAADGAVGAPDPARCVGTGGRAPRQRAARAPTRRGARICSGCSTRHRASSPSPKGRGTN